MEFDFSVFLTSEALIGLLTLAALEIVLGIDNVIFLAIISGRLETEAKRRRARQVGLTLAALMRIGLLFAIAWIMSLDEPWFTVLGVDISGKSLILILGGAFLVAKSVLEIHHKLESHDESESEKRSARSSVFWLVILQILMIDLVFSLDSVITAVGMIDHVEVMVVAILIATAVMLIFAGPVSRFVERNPTIKMLALAFLILIGVLLIADGIGHHIPKGYVYFAMAFSLVVELLNLRARRKRKLVTLNQSALPEDGPQDPAQTSTE